LFSKADNWEGQLLHILARTGEQNYVGYGLWESEKKGKRNATDDWTA